MKWYYYISAFFSGMFLANAVPHFVNGISGNPFPTPFANPPGQGLSSPLVNVIWASFNIVVGYFLFRRGRIVRPNSNNNLSFLIFFLGVLCISVMLSIAFIDKAKSN